MAESEMSKQEVHKNKIDLKRQLRNFRDDVKVGNLETHWYANMHFDKMQIHIFQKSGY